MHWNLKTDLDRRKVIEKEYSRKSPTRTKFYWSEVLCYWELHAQGKKQINRLQNARTHRTEVSFCLEKLNLPDLIEFYCHVYLYIQLERPNQREEKIFNNLPILRSFTKQHKMTVHSGKVPHDKNSSHKSTENDKHNR